MTPTQLQQAINYLFPTAANPRDYTVNVDSSGNGTIALWNNALGAQPTADQLNTALAATQLTPAQQAMTVSLTATYNSKRYGAPVTIALAAGPSVAFPTDTYTQDNVIGYLTAYDTTDWPTSGVPLQDTTGKVQTLAYADVKALAKAIAGESVSVWQTLQGLLAQVTAATTVAAVNAIAWPTS